MATYTLNLFSLLFLPPKIAFRDLSKVRINLNVNIILLLFKYVLCSLSVITCCIWIEKNIFVQSFIHTFNSLKGPPVLNLSADA